MFGIIDRLAGAWLNWRRDQAIQRDPVLREDFNLRKLEINDGNVKAVFEHPAILTLAEESASLLQATGARNYFEFDIMPRFDRGLKPIRITVAWAHGIAPGTKARIYEDLLRRAAPHVSSTLFDEIKNALARYGLEEQ